MRITRAAGVALVLLAGFAAPFSAAAGGEEEGPGGGGPQASEQGGASADSRAGGCTCAGRSIRVEIRGSHSTG